MQREDFIDFVWSVLLSFLTMKEEGLIEELSLSEIGERYAVFRIVRPGADLAMMKSIQRYGQMSPVVCVKTDRGYELIDGFKRLRACRRLNKPVVKSKTVQFSERASKAAIIQLNRSGGSITEMEEALVLQALHREDGLTQIEISVLVGRHKSWVSRRLSLLERLIEEIQQDLRLGLLSVSMGRELAKLPRGNQRAAADAVLKHRFSVREVEKLTAHLLTRPRGEHQAILMAPWEIIEPKQSRPAGIEAKLISFERICRSLSEGVKSSRIGSNLYEPIERAVGAAEEVVRVLRAVSSDRQAEI
ncbi:MAG: ParB N-terminal domain-containing protein [Deltaproteobacteria bacterium]|nr:ParB N-terminal domain-containing protein [Deltaproteobacteria bacterium]